jgi:hypothetical protein
MERGREVYCPIFKNIIVTQLPNPQHSIGQGGRGKVSPPYVYAFDSQVELNFETL